MTGSRTLLLALLLVPIGAQEAVETGGDPRARLERGIALAEEQRWDEALRELNDLGGATDPELRDCAAFGRARVLHERAALRRLPALEGEPRSDVDRLADARARIGAVRADLELARAELLALLERRHRERDLLVALAHVCARLEEVERRERDFGLRGESVAVSGAGADRPRRLRPGSAAERSAAGAPGERHGDPRAGSTTGAGDGAAGAEAPASADLGAWSPEAIEAALDELRRERDALDERRGNEAFARAGARRH